MIIGLIQARMMTSRLPGKVLLPLEEKPVLWHIHNRLSYSKLIDQVCISSTTNPLDDKIEEFALHNGIRLYRGSETNLVRRHLEAAKKFGADIIVRITADCPLVDPQVVDQVISLLKKDNTLDFVSNTKIRTFPVGLDVEVFPTSTLEKILPISENPIFYEYFVGNHVYENPNLFKSDGISLEQPNLLRWTLDYPEDYEFMKKIYKGLYRKDKIFLMKDILEFLKKHPEIEKINSKYTSQFSFIKYSKEKIKDP